MSTSADLARSERQALCDLLEQTGPEAPTLCAGWTTRDLAAHLVTREARPDAALGVIWRPLASHGERLRLETAGRPWADLIRTLRQGPPALSPLRPVDGIVNHIEFLIHHEDVRRGGPSWTTRELDAATERFLWGRLTVMSRMMLRSAPVQTSLHWTGQSQDIVVRRDRRASGHVVISGNPMELLMYVHGRDACIVDVQGETAAVSRWSAHRLGS
jgi:uncharacterized protein (TIGR03085 family)